jgi:UTP:GlnB (protein PII) uridylyltransferase
VNKMISALLPITDGREVAAFLQRVPLAVDRGHFAEFVLGFPHKYLAATPAPMVLKHYMLMESLRDKGVISSLSRDGALSKLILVARDRSALFARIAGTLSSFGADIVGAEAFANANSMVLDTFTFVDPQHRFSEDAARRQFQVLLEQVVEGKADVDSHLRERLDATAAALASDPLDVAFDGQVHPQATVVTVSGPNLFGLLYLLARTFAAGGYNIEMAYVETPEGRARDQFFVTHGGKKLTPPLEDDLRRRIGAPAPSGL